ncbi:MAG: DUF1501 domain-containing protein [Deltaproteobacteria bacterium]|nr:DUF1501 domain-containing protein [Deltaproteobacteria bacterium]
MTTSRRGFLKTALGAAALAGASLAAPTIWTRRAWARTDAFGRAKHLIYIRLRGGFRFTCAFNGDVAAEWNPFGLATRKADGCAWGMSRLLEPAPFLDGDDGAQRVALGMRPVPDLGAEITVVPCVDHEPTAGRADGNHGSGLERYWTGSVGGDAGFLTLINYGLRARYQATTADGQVAIPAFCLGDAGMARGLGVFAAHRPPVVQSGGFDGFGLSTEDRVPAWARGLSKAQDERYRDRLRAAPRAAVDAYLETRKATLRFAEVFRDPILQVGDGDTPIDGLSQDQLRLMFGDSDAGRNLRLALRLFHFGCSAVYVDQGGYDMHSGEENGLPGDMIDVNRLISALFAALKAMTHPAGGTYWDHTVVAIGSEFGRTAGGNRFNSARGSDHGGDYATRWMSMPFFGGPVVPRGAQLGQTRPSDLAPEGEVVGYRAVLKSLLDVLGCDSEDLFPADPPYQSLFVG